MDMTAIKKLAFDTLAKKKSHEWKETGNKHTHGARVAKLALTLRRELFPGDDTGDDILTVAAWFHDIMNGVEDHAKEGAKEARKLLAQYCTQDELERICEIIGVHDDRFSGRDTFSSSIKLHQDADLLDHFGTFYVWVNFQYSAGHDESIQNTIAWLQKDRVEFVEKYREQLNYEVSRRIYDEKVAFSDYFVNRFAAEGDGEIWNKAEFLTKV